MNTLLNLIAGSQPNQSRDMTFEMRPILPCLIYVAFIGQAFHNFSLNHPAFRALSSVNVPIAHEAIGFMTYRHRLSPVSPKMTVLGRLMPT